MADFEALDLKHLFHPNTNLATLHESGPLVLSRGEGIHVWDTHGKRYIEGIAGLWCTTLGYGDEELAETIYEQSKKLSFAHMFAAKSHEPGILLAQKLASMAPFDATRVFFGNSGSDGNDTQMRLVWYYHNAIGQPQKKKIISRQRGYHGTTFAAASLTGLSPFHQNFDAPLDFVRHTECPYFYRNAEPGETEAEYSTRLADALEKLIIDEGPDTIGAFIAEPMMAVGGVLLPPEGYFEKVQAVLDKYDILMIDDEVICGFGRTGNLWGAQTFRMKPDSITVAKALSSAYLPISGVIVPEFLYEPMIEASGRSGLFGHGFTYSGHPVAAAAALKTLEIYEARKLYEHVRRITPKFQARLAALGDHPLVGEARGIGLLGAVELVQNKTTKAPFDGEHTIAARCLGFCQQNGLIVRAVGDAVALCPPYIVTEAQVDEIFDLFGKGLDSTLDWATRQKLL